MAVWSVVPFSRVGEALRFDSDYWRSEYVEYEDRALESGGRLSSFVREIIQPSEFIREYVEAADGIEFWRAQNVRRGYVTRGTAEFIERDVFNSVPNAHAQEGDVLIVRTGANASDTASVPAGVGDVAVSSHTLRLVPNSVAIGHTLGLLFASDLGRSLLMRVTSGSTRPQITKEGLSLIALPDLSRALDHAPGWVEEYYETQERARQRYADAEALLADALGLGGLVLPTPKTYTAMFSDTAAAERLDAEHFNPRVRAIRQHVLSKFEGVPLGSLGAVLKGKTPKYSDEGIPVIRSGDLSDIDDTSAFKRTAPKSARFRLRAGDVLISSIGFGSIGKVQIFDHPEPHTTVSEVTVVRQSVLNPYFLQAFLASPLGQAQIESWVTGATGQLHLRPADVEKVIVPIIPRDQQDEFEHVVTDARRLRAESVRQLAAATARVEALVLAA